MLPSSHVVPCQVRLRGNSAAYHYRLQATTSSPHSSGNNKSRGVWGAAGPPLPRLAGKGIRLTPSRGGYLSLQRLQITSRHYYSCVPLESMLPSSHGVPCYAKLRGVPVGRPALRTITNYRQRWGAHDEQPMTSCLHPLTVTMTRVGGGRISSFTRLTPLFAHWPEPLRPSRRFWMVLRGSRDHPACGPESCTAL